MFAHPAALTAGERRKMTYDIYDVEQQRRIGSAKNIRQVIQLFGENVGKALRMSKNGVVNYGKYQIEKRE